MYCFSPIHVNQFFEKRNEHKQKQDKTAQLIDSQPNKQTSERIRIQSEYT